MENISFVIWMVLYPLASAVGSFYNAKERVVTGREPYSEDTLGVSALVKPCYMDYYWHGII